MDRSSKSIGRTNTNDIIGKRATCIPRASFLDGNQSLKQIKESYNRTLKYSFKDDYDKANEIKDIYNINIPQGQKVPLKTNINVKDEPIKIRSKFTRKAQSICNLEN